MLGISRDTRRGSAYRSHLLGNDRVRFGGEKNGFDIQDGMKVAPSRAATLPHITFENAKEGSLYTIIISDPDAPDPANPTHRGRCMTGFKLAMPSPQRVGVGGQ
jgi:phosphatidylethanolamine-binding protein (PEBP) family uncharacterized protein